MIPDYYNPTFPNEDMYVRKALNQMNISGTLDVFEELDKEESEVQRLEEKQIEPRVDEMYKSMVFSHQLFYFGGGYLVGFVPGCIIAGAHIPSFGESLLVGFVAIPVIVGVAAVIYVSCYRDNKDMKDNAHLGAINELRPVRLVRLKAKVRKINDFKKEKGDNLSKKEIEMIKMIKDFFEGKIWACEH